MNYSAFLLEGETPGMEGIWIIMIVMLGLMWFFTSRSQKKKDKEAQDMRDSLQVGDEVTTIGGIIGKVVSIKEDTFVLETTKEKTHIRFLKGAIRTIDVKIADVTAAALETRETPAEQAPAEEAPAEENSKGAKGLFKKKK